MWRSRARQNCAQGGADLRGAAARARTWSRSAKSGEPDPDPPAAGAARAGGHGGTRRRLALPGGTSTRRERASFASPAQRGKGATRGAGTAHTGREAAREE